MANPQNSLNQNATPQAQALAQAMQDALNAQGDYNNLVKNSIKDLNATVKNYEKIEAKLASINKSAINTKEIENEISRATESRYKNDKKLAQLEQSLTTQRKAGAETLLRQTNKVYEIEQELIELRRSGNTLTIRAKEAELSSAESILNRITDQLNTEQLAYAQALKTKELDDEIEAGLKRQLATENAIKKDIGISGILAGKFADKIGIGEKFYKNMTERARELNAEGKKMTFTDKLKVMWQSGKESLKEAWSDPAGRLAILGGAFSMLGGVIGGIVNGLKQVFDYILGIEDKTVKFGRAMNMSREAAKQLKMEYASINISNGNLFVNTQKLMDSQVEMVEMLGVTNRLSNEILSTNIELKDIAGIEAETRKELASTATITGQTMKETAKSVLTQVVGLKNATGIQLEYRKILKEVASLGGYLGLQFSKYPAALSKSLVTVKAMGLELKQVDSMASSFLDFESSISKEFEAQLLTGKEINLNKARELFLNNDLAGAAAEITSQVGNSVDFMKMNRIQAESFAQAFGMSRDQLGDMLKQQELFAAFGAKNTKQLQDQVMLYKQQGREKEAIALLGSEEAYQSMVNASMQEKIAAFMDKIKQSISDFVENTGIIDKIQKAMDWLSSPENIRNVMMTVRDTFANIVEYMGKMAYYIVNAFDYLSLGSIDNNFINGIKSGSLEIADRIRSMGGNMEMGGVSVGGNASTNAAAGSTTNVSHYYRDPREVARAEGNNIVLYVDGKEIGRIVNASNSKDTNVRQDWSRLHSHQ